MATQSSTPVAPSSDCSGQEHVEGNLAQFERVDFEAWNNRDWDLFRQLHADSVYVDGFGQATKGVDAHTEWAQAYIAENPTSMILSHPLRIAAGDWTVVTGEMSDGTKMCMIARWENGEIAEEHLYTLQV